MHPTYTVQKRVAVIKEIVTEIVSDKREILFENNYFSEFTRIAKKFETPAKFKHWEGLNKEKKSCHHCGSSGVQSKNIWSTSQGEKEQNSVNNFGFTLSSNRGNS